MKRKQTFGQIVITAMFLWSALLCHFEASSLRDEGDLTAAIIYWICGFTAIMGALSLYLDFINLFIFLLRIFGQRR